MWRRQPRSVEARLLHRLETRGMKAFILLPSAEAPYLERTRSPVVASSGEAE